VLLVKHIKITKFLLGVAFPIKERLSIDDVYDRRTGKPKSEILKDHFIKEGRIEEESALRIINGST
jgi:serine/threonine-protein phosphatase 2B catalytic subunit